MRRTWPTVAILLFVLAHLPAPTRAQVSPGPLSRAHAGLEGIRNCRSCHGGSDGVGPKCLQCHTEIAWYVENGRGLHGRTAPEDCARCHPEHGGIDFELVDWGGAGIEGFAHERAGWALSGAHVRTPCAGCHRPDLRVRAIEVRRPAGSDASTWVGLDTACKSCHADPHRERLGPACETCHTTTSFQGVTDFDHGRTGYPLRGRHARLQCAACHAQGKFGTTAREGARSHLAPIRHDDCNACHRDPHQSRFGTTCARCHVEDDFRTVSAATFDHDRTRYPIRGAHTRVSCERCHDTAKGGFGARPAHDRCDRCHGDAHAGTATLAGSAVDCAACHEVGGFAPSTYGVREHASARFVLEGKHTTVACTACHRREAEGVTRLGPARVELRPVATECRSCHLDAHAGQLAASPSQGACEACHDARAWAPSTYTRARHDETALALRGAHAALDCRRCHGPEREGLRALDPSVDRGTARIALRLPERACEDCHRDVHAGRYLAGGAEAARGPCSACHTATSFAPSSVDVEDHARFRFPLDGAHRSAPCILCHPSLDRRERPKDAIRALIEDAPSAEVVLWDVSSACQDCHRPKGTP